MSTAEHLNLLLKVCDLLHCDEGLHEALHQLLKEVLATLNAETGFVVIQEGDELRPVAGHQVSLGRTLDEESFSTKAVRNVLETGKPHLVLNPVSNSLFSSTSVTMLGIRSILCAPLAWGGKVHGAIYLDNRLSHGVYREEHVEILTAIASQASRSLERAFLYDQLKLRGDVTALETVDTQDMQSVEQLVTQITTPEHSEERASHGVRLFGELQAWSPGRDTVSWKTRKDEELFCYLALHGNGLVHEESLAELFWPESKKPRHSLQNAITQIRKALDDRDAVVRRHQGYAVGEHLWIDHQAFLAASKEGREAVSRADWEVALPALQQAEKLASATLLRGIEAEWLDGFRMEAENQLLFCRAAQADHFAQRGRHLLAAEVWRKVLAIDPCHDGAYRGLLSALMLLGKKPEARRVLQQAEKAYREHLDLDLPEELRAIV